MPPGQPPPGALPPPEPLRKFPLHPSTLIVPPAPIAAVASSNGPLLPPAIATLRTALLTARATAADRPAIRDANRRTVTDRQAAQSRLVEEAARLKDLERKRKREEDEKRERERAERAERDRLERERDDRLAQQKQEEEYQLARTREEDDKRLADERDRATVLREAQESTEARLAAAAALEAEEVKHSQDKDKLVEVLKLVRANEADHILPPSLPLPDALLPAAAVAADVDIDMADSPQPFAFPPHPTEPLPEVYLPGTADHSITPSIMIDTTPDVEEDEDGQPRPPHRVKTHDNKRKRDHILDSDGSDGDDDDEPIAQKIRKVEEKAASGGPTAPTSRSTSQAPVAEIVAPPKEEGLSIVQQMLKEDKYVKHSIPTKPPAAGTAQAFYLPSHSLVPPKPVSVPPAPTPKKQSEVCEDFSKAKPGTQITHNVFHTWADAYLRPFGEDDLAFLAPKPEDIGPYLIPPLGIHYTDRWEEEDADVPVASTSYVSQLEPPRLQRFRPEALTEDALGTEGVFLGPLSERLIAALAFEEVDEDNGELEERVERDETLAVQKSQLLDAVELEERVKRELKFIGVLPEEDVDWSSREDDEVSSSLRACQRALQRQTLINEARKAVLSALVKDRMAYQDYETTRDAQERVIENGWTKRQRAGKKKGKSKERDKPSEGPKPPVSLALLSAVEKRHKLVSLFRPFFEEEGYEGRYFGLPEKSIYEGTVVEGLDEEQDLSRMN